MANKPTAIITGPVYQQHDTGQHAENPARTKALRHMAAELLAASGGSFSSLEPARAEVGQIAAVHDQRYIEALQRFCEAGGGQIDLNTTASPGSYEAALYAAGGLLRGIEAVLAGEAANAFALVRPPGHHAVPQGSLGFCLFNNVAVAARYLLDVRGLERVLIVDWDVHHGNGTQDIFYDDPRVLFFSSHQDGTYPGTGSFWETGEGRGKGFNVNLPLPAGSGDAVLERAFEVLLEPLAARFKPEFILVSAGYDGHWRDPLARLNLSAEGYARLTRRVIQLADTYCQGRLALTLEGGYNIEALTSSVRATLEVLAGASAEEAATEDQVGPGPGGYSPELEPFRDLWQEARQLHKV
jgi:acetoin utilization deacetylase AcuC-like enzyme